VRELEPRGSRTSRSGWDHFGLTILQGIEMPCKWRDCLNSGCQSLALTHRCRPSAGTTAIRGMSCRSSYHEPRLSAAGGGPPCRDRAHDAWMITMRVLAAVQRRMRKAWQSFCGVDGAFALKGNGPDPLVLEGPAMRGRGSAPPRGAKSAHVLPFIKGEGQSTNWCTAYGVGLAPQSSRSTLIRLPLPDLPLRLR